MLERTAPPTTVAALLHEAVAQLERSGVAHPRREATHLWAAGEGMTPGAVWLAREGAPREDAAQRFREAVARRASGVPFAYAVGRASFRQLDLKLDPRALIPRPETEGMVDLVLAARRAMGPGPRARRAGGVVADVGTGCGCIALSLAVEGDFERVLAVERSAEAAALARENAALVGPPVPVDVREGDLLAPLGGERLQAIVSNPPYLSAAEYVALDPAVRRFEPRGALVSGADGLAATRALLAGGRALLEPGGLIALELDERRAAATRALAQAHGWSRVAVHEDLFGRPRFLLAFS